MVTQSDVQAWAENFHALIAGIMRDAEGWDLMQLAKEVKTFSSVYEHILSAIALGGHLPLHEAAMTGILLCGKPRQNYIHLAQGCILLVLR